ncbi:MAG: hypothetical protein SFU86_14345 [Pirellulaceae bacterium]|nr:hypothetical protein [Pirellulaceae bacterium]
MNTEPHTTADLDEELVAYLDGELDPAACARVERRLADDPAYRSRLAGLERAWDLLDTLQRTEADDNFTRSTVEMVALRAEDEVATETRSARQLRGLAWAGLAAAACLAAALGFVAIRARLERPNRALARDLPVIEKIDQLGNVDSVDFLQQLQNEGLFAAEVANEE